MEYFFSYLRHVQHNAVMAAAVLLLIEDTKNNIFSTLIKRMIIYHITAKQRWHTCTCNRFIHLFCVSGSM